MVSAVRPSSGQNFCGLISQKVRYSAKQQRHGPIGANFRSIMVRSGPAAGGGALCHRTKLYMGWNLEAGQVRRA